MFRQVRFQTGEIEEIIKEMRKGNIPCMDVDDNQEYEWFVKQLESHGIYRDERKQPDRKARDMIKEPEFEFRMAFLAKANEPEDKLTQMFIDFYFEPVIEETYDTIFGD